MTFIAQLDVLRLRAGSNWLSLVSEPERDLGAPLPRLSLALTRAGKIAALQNPSERRFCDCHAGSATLAVNTLVSGM